MTEELVTQSSGTRSESRAVAVGRAHVEAFTNRNWDKARSVLAEDVHYTLLTSADMPGLDNKGIYENSGIENFMRDLSSNPDFIVPGSARIVSSMGDDDRALLIVTFDSRLGPTAEKNRFVAARHYLIDEKAKIKTEQVILFPIGGPTPGVAAKSDAVSVGEAHVKAFTKRDYDKARRLLANDVHYTVLTTVPGMHSLNNFSADNFMKDLTAFADAIVSNSARVVESIGDYRRALIVMTYEAPFGTGGARLKLVRAAHYLLDENRKIKTEQVIFFPLTS